MTHHILCLYYFFYTFYLSHPSHTYHYSICAKFDVLKQIIRNSRNYLLFIREYLITFVLPDVFDFFSIFLTSYLHTSHIILLAIYDLQTVNSSVFYNFAFLKISPLTHTNTLSYHTFPPYQ